jgi:hypothetical protein
MRSTSRPAASLAHTSPSLADGDGHQEDVFSLWSKDVPAPGALDPELCGAPSWWLAVLPGPHPDAPTA